MNIKNLVFIESYFNMSTKEATKWIDNHTQEEIDTIFNEYNEYMTDSNKLCSEI